MKNVFIPLFLLITCLSSLSSCMLFRGKATAKDFEKFPATTIKKAANPYILPENIGNIRLPETIHLFKENQDITFEKAVEASGTLALLVIKNDTLVYENYYGGKSSNSVVTSFSVAKSFVSALIGIAIEEGHIGSIHDKVIHYLPTLDQAAFKDLTIEHLLDMNSGIKFLENYVFGIQIGKYYYGKNIKKQIPKLKLKGVPGENDDYKSVNTQLLGLIIEAATGQSLSQYMQTKLWQPLGASHDASWSIDSEKNQTEKAFCCINARARDYAKFGAMYANKGYWNGQQIVPEAWVEKTTFVLWEHWKEMTFGYHSSWHKNHWTNFMRLETITKETKNQLQESDKLVTIDYNFQTREQVATEYIAKATNIHFSAVGHLGQYIYVIPEQKLVMVRFGLEEGNIWWAGLFEDIAALNKTFE